MKKIFNWKLGVVLLLAVAGYFAYGEVYFRITGKHLNPDAIVDIKGDSMSPTYTDGQLVVYSKNNVKPKVGDVVVVYCPDKCEIDELIIKRVAVIDENDCWEIQGDNKLNSLDSDKYGKLCPDDRYVYGIVHKTLDN
jgi:phage repressor protein C with HTH and peptisase S24 domain